MDKLRATIETSVRDSRSAESDTVIAAAVEAPDLRCYAKITRANAHPTLFVTVEQIDRWGQRNGTPLARLQFEQDENGMWLPASPEADHAPQT